MYMFSMACGALFIASIICFSLSFDTLDPSQRGLLHNRINSEVYEQVFKEGRYFIWIGRGFLKWPYNLMTVNFNGGDLPIILDPPNVTINSTSSKAGSGIVRKSIYVPSYYQPFIRDTYGRSLRCWSKEGQLIEMDISFAYRIRASSLYSFYSNFGPPEKEIDRRFFAGLLYATTKETAMTFAAIDFFERRKDIVAQLEKNIQTAFAVWGADLNAIQLRRIGIPNVFESTVIAKVVENQNQIYQQEQRKIKAVQYATKLIEAEAEATIMTLKANATANGNELVANATNEGKRKETIALLDGTIALATNLGLDTKEKFFKYMYNRIIKKKSFEKIYMGYSGNNAGQKVIPQITPEIQEVRTSANYSTGATNELNDDYSWKLNFMGEQTALIQNSDTSATVKQRLEALTRIGEVEVSKVGPDAVKGNSWFITFLTNQGNVPTLTVSDITNAPGATGASITVTEKRKGTGPSNIMFQYR